MYDVSSTNAQAAWDRSQEQSTQDGYYSHGQQFRAQTWQAPPELPSIAQQYPTYNVAHHPDGSEYAATSAHQTHPYPDAPARQAQSCEVSHPLYLDSARGIGDQSQVTQGTLRHQLDHAQHLQGLPGATAHDGTAASRDVGRVYERAEGQRQRKKQRRENPGNSEPRKRDRIPKAAPPRKPTRRGGRPDTAENLAAYEQERAMAEAVPNGPFVSNIERPPTTRESGASRLRLIDRFPPVVGDYLHYPNKVVAYHGIPPDVDQVREAMFHVRVPVLLGSSQAIADYWPHCSNIWQRLRRHTGQNSNSTGAVVEIYECRLHERVRESHRMEAVQNVRKRVRKTDNIDNGEGKDCRFRIHITTFTKHADTPEEHGGGLEAKCKCIPEWLYMSQLTASNDCHQGYDTHSHSLRLLNDLKNSAALMFFAKVKVEQGYSYQAVYEWMVQKYAKVTQQMEFLNKRDVCNVSREWRESHPDRILRSKVVDEANLPVLHGQSTSDRCRNAIAGSSADGLRAALYEICTRIPQASEIALPLLERAHAAARLTNPGGADNGVKAGYDLEVPYPGLPPGTIKRSTKQNGPQDRTVPSLSEVLQGQGMEQRLGVRHSIDDQRTPTVNPKGKVAHKNKVTGGPAATASHADPNSSEPSQSEQANTAEQAPVSTKSSYATLPSGARDHNVDPEIRERRTSGGEDAARTNAEEGTS